MLSFSTHCARLGFPLKNARWSWCAQSRDGSRVLFTIWLDELAKDRFVLFPTSERRPGEIALAANSTLGAREIQHIAKLAANDSTVSAFGVICIARDPSAVPRRRKSYDPKTLRKLKVFQEGESFIACSVGEVTVADFPLEYRVL